MTDTCSSGIVYIATGTDFVQEAKISARSVTEAMAGIDITLITDEPLPNDGTFDQVMVVDELDYGFVDKITHLDKSPYERSLYLDTDTYVTEDIRDVFDLLEQFDIGAVHNQDGVAWELEDVPKPFPEYNTGVIVYKNSEEFSEFLKDWKIEYYKMVNDNTQNQPSFRKAVYESDLRITTLPTEYNCMIHFPGHVCGSVKIFHGRLLDLDSPGAGQYFDMDEAIRKINNHTENRVFSQLGGITVHSNKPTIFHKAIYSVQKRGLKNTIRRVVSS